MSSSGSNPSDRSSKPTAKPEKPAKASWRGKAQAGTDGPRYGWQSAANKDIDPGRIRKTVWFRVKVIGFSLLVLALFGVFVYILPRQNPRTPFLAVALTNYRAPVSPNPWAREDIEGFDRLAGEAGTLEFANLSDGWASKEQALESLEKQLQKARKSSSQAKVVVVYLSVHGITDEAGNPCLLFPQASRFDSGSWLPLREVVNRLKTLPESVNKLLILDSSRMDTNWSLGILYNTFADRLTEFVEHADVPGLVILNSSSPGESVWASPELKGSVVGTYVLKGLAGAADQKNEGNSDRAVTLQELYAYLKHHVAQWARENRADVQVPMLVPDKDFTVVYARGGLLGRFGSSGTSTSKTEEKGAEDETSKVSTSAQDEEIAKLWQSLDKLSPHVVYRVDPVGWQHFVQKLMRLEQLVSAGSAYSAEAEETLQKLRSASDTLGQPRALPRPLVAHTLPLAEAFGLFKENGKQRADLAIAFDKADPDLKPEKFSYLARADVAWNSFLKDQRRETATNAIRFAGTPDSGLEPGVIETHFLRMLERHLERESWQEQTRDLIEQAITTRNQAERIAALRTRAPDNTMSPTTDERCQYWVYNHVEQGDKARRLAEDGLFVGGRKQLEESRDLWRDAAKEYDAAQQVAAQVEDALRWRDQAWAELPFLAPWLIRHSADDGDSSDPVNDLLLPLIRNTHKLAAILDQQLDSESPNPDTFGPTLQEIRRDLKDLTDLYRTDCDDLTKAGDDQTTLRRIAAALAVPLMPPSEREKLRKRYQSIARTLQASFPDTARGSSKARSEDNRGSNSLDRVVVQWDEHPALAMLSRESLGRIAGAKRQDHEKLAADAAPGDKWAAVEKSGGAVRESLASLSAESSKWLESSTQKLSKLAGSTEARVETRSDRSQADRLVRAAAALLADPPESQPELDPVHQLRLLDLHNLLVWHCQRTLDDFWGPTDPTSQFERPFFDVAAEKYLETAKDLCKTGVSSRPKQDEPLVARFESLRAITIPDAAKRWTTLSADAISLDEEDDEPEMDHSVTVALDPKLPAGGATFFLRNSGDATIPIRQKGQVAYSRRAMLPVEASAGNAAAPLGYRLNRADVLASGSKLSAIALYRGHQQSYDVAIDSPKGIRLENLRPENPKTFVTVSGQAGVRGSVVLILDCSASMGEPSKIVAEGAAERNRFDVARGALDTLLTRLEAGKFFHVGIRFYGHRVGFVPGKGFAKQEQKGWKPPDKKPITDIWPGGDEERIRRIGLFTRDDLADIRERLATLKPWGVTPLYLSIVRSLQEDFVDESKEAPKSIVVITDGDNKQYPEDPAAKRELVKSVSDVLREISTRNNIRIYMLGFELKPDEERTVRPDFEQIAKASRGAYFPANDWQQLEAALQKLIPNQYSVLGTDAGQALPKEKDWVDVDRQAEATIPSARLGRKNKFTVQVKNTDPVVKTDLALEGGESIQLLVSKDGLKLEHQLYQARSPKFSSQPPAKQGLPDPSDPARQFRIGVHRPAPQGTSVQFPISIQNADSSLFSPRPAEAWVEITPVIQGVPNPKQSYSFYDLTFEEGRPVPVLSCVAPAWPSGAGAADVRIWFKMRQTEPNQRSRIREVANKQEADGGLLKIAGVPGVTFSVKTKPRKNPSDDYRIVVTERHPPGDPNFYSAKVELDPPAKRTAHRFDSSANSVVHTFYVSADVPDNVLMNDYELRLTSRKALEQDAIQWGTPTPIKIPGPGDLAN